MADLDLSARVEAVAAKARARNAERAVAEETKQVADQQSRADMRAALRESMPTVARFVDDVRSVFGEVRVLMAEENGRRVESALYKRRGW